MEKIIQESKLKLERNKYKNDNKDLYKILYRYQKQESLILAQDKRWRRT